MSKQDELYDYLSRLEGVVIERKNLYNATFESKEAVISYYQGTLHSVRLSVAKAKRLLYNLGSQIATDKETIIDIKDYQLLLTRSRILDTLTERNMVSREDLEDVTLEVVDADG